MIKFTYKYDNEEIASIENVSKLSNKKVWQTFNEAVTVHNKFTLTNELADIRERMEIENVIIDCNYNPLTENFDTTYLASTELAEMIEQRLSKPGKSFF